MTLRQLVMVVTMLAAPVSPAAAQGRLCDDGRGAEMADLGFDRLRQSGGKDGARVFEGTPRVTGVRAEGPAAGQLRDGDVLLAIDGEAITSAAAARRYAGLRGGEVVRLRVMRDGQEHDVTVTAATRCVPFPPAPPAPPAPPDAPAAPLPPAGELMPRARLGFTLECTDCGDESSGGVTTFRFRRAPSVAGVEPGSDAAKAGVRAGDLLTKLGDMPLTSAGAWPRWSAIQPGDRVTLTFSRDGRTLEVTLQAR